MIFDRTQEHVERAKVLISEKVKQGQILTEDDISVLERGTLTINTINRIEAKSKELYEKLNEAAYYSSGIDTKEYTYNDIFIESDFQKMLDNLDVLIKSYYTNTDTPNIPTAKYHFKNFNAIEKTVSFSVIGVETPANDTNASTGNGTDNNSTSGNLS